MPSTLLWRTVDRAADREGAADVVRVAAEVEAHAHVRDRTVLRTTNRPAAPGVVGLAARQVYSQPRSDSTHRARRDRRRDRRHAPAAEPGMVPPSLAPDTGGDRVVAVAAGAVYPVAVDCTYAAATPSGGAGVRRSVPHGEKWPLAVHRVATRPGRRRGPHRARGGRIEDRWRIAGRPDLRAIDLDLRRARDAAGHRLDGDDTALKRSRRSTRCR